MRDFLKSYFIEVIIVLIFILLLFSIPKLFGNNQGKIEYTLTSPVIQENQTEGKILEITKYQVIADKVIEDFVTTSIENSDSKIITNLIINNKITNKQNSIAQEMISLYDKKDFADVKEIAYELIEKRLDKYDRKENRKWRNEALYIFHNNDTYLIYENINLLLKATDSEMVGFSKTKIRPYAYEIYNFTYVNGTSEIVTINLKTKESDKELNQFIDTNTGKPKMEFKSITSEFVESNEEYIIEFIIWR